MAKIKKQAVLLLIPLGIVTCLLIYSWGTFLLTDMIPMWRHYVALGLFAVVVYLYFTDFKKAAVAASVYLLLATLNALSLTPVIKAYWIKFGNGVSSVKTPPVSILSLMLLILFLVLNFDTLSDMYLDYKEAKSKRNN